MDIFGCIVGGATDHNLLTVIVPLQDRPRADAKFPANLGGDGDLALRRELRVGNRHRQNITTVMNNSQKRANAVRC